MDSCDVLIIGGGPAGAACAWQLRRAGADVVIWDRRAFPRDKVCAGWITPQILTALDLDIQAYAAGGRTLQPIRGFRLSRLGDADTCVRYAQPVSYAIRRCEFDDYLVRRSTARLRLGEPVGSLKRLGQSWVLNDALRANVLVGAGGHFCPVARHLGARLGAGEPIIAAQEMEYALTASQQRASTVEPELPELFFSRDLKGYGWVVRKGSYINIGLGRQDSHTLAQHVEHFLAFLEQHGKIPAASTGKLRGHPYLLYGDAARPLVGDAALLIGDAAGLAYPKSGEGIRPAIESGLLAAQTLIEAEGNYTESRLAAYERRVLTRFGPRRPDWGISDVLPERIASSVAGWFFRRPWFARRVVLDRWFFHADQPPLVLEPLGAPETAVASASQRLAG
jgi:flavin-dependent dehydrogenase